MKLSNRAIYGIRALFDLAYHGGQGPVQIREIAEREDIPLRFLEQIFQDLRRAELVESKRGPKGGFLLSREPREISLALALEALEDAPQFYSPGEDGATPTTPQDKGASASWIVPDAVCAQAFAEISRMFKEITLADIMERGEEFGLQRDCYESFTYVI
jgi:Rrf2 family protein